MEGPEIEQFLKEGIKNLHKELLKFNREDDQEFNSLPIMQQLEETSKEVYQSISTWADWKQKESQVKLAKMRGEL